MFTPFGRSVPSLKINLILCCLRLMLLRIETVGRALNRHQWETARHQRSVRGYHRGIAHADMIPAEVRGKSCVPWVGGQDVEIVKQDPSGADVEWIIR